MTTHLIWAELVSNITPSTEVLDSGHLRPRSVTVTVDPRNRAQHFGPYLALGISVWTVRRALIHDTMTLSGPQIFAIAVTERVCSTISLIGTFVIVATFIWSPSFRKPINRLVFYASWGNIMANIATIISADGIHLGVDSSLCQFQGFLIQWFVPRGDVEPDHY